MTRPLFHIAEAFSAPSYDVAVVARAMTQPGVQREIDGLSPGVVIRTQHTGAYPRWSDVAPIRRRAWRALWKSMGQEAYAARLSYGWGQWLDVNDVLRRLGNLAVRPSLLWGYCGGYLEGATGAQRLAAVLDVPWVFELQDPPRYCGLGPSRSSVCVEFRPLLSNSPHVVVTTEAYRDCLINEYRISGERVDTIYLTYDGKIAEPKVRSDGRFRLVYAGSLSGGRSIAPVIRGLAEALRRAPEMRGRMELELIGARQGFGDAEALARKLGIVSHVYPRGYMSITQTELHVADADALIVLQTEEGSRLQVPGKLFEALRAGKPILGVMPVQCEAADILRRSGLGIIHSMEDVEGIAESLVSQWRKWKAGQTSLTPDHEYIRQFSTERLPEKLSAVLGRITSGGPE